MWPSNYWEIPHEPGGHLKKHHPDCFRELATSEEEYTREEERKVKAKAERKAVGPVKQIKTLTEVMHRKYDKSSSRWQIITRKVAMFTSSNNVLNSIGENPEFRLMVEALDPCYQMPSRSRMERKWNC